MERWAQANGWVAGAALALLATGCSGGSASPAATTAAVQVIEPSTTIPPSDGVLRIGLLVPQSGSGAAFGEPLDAGAQLALDQINRAGGVNGRPVEMIRRDEGPDLDTAGQGMAQLIDDGADAIVGPASSATALGTLRQAIVAGKLVCSPTASAIALTKFPDNNQFIRTMPSDAVEAQALAQVMSRSGRGTAVTLVPDDAFGDGYQTALQAALAALHIQVVASLVYDPASENLGPVARDALAAQPELIAIAGDATGGSRMLEAVGATGDTNVELFVSSALRRTPLSDTAKPTTTALLQRVHGVAPRATPDDKAFVEAMTRSDIHQSLDYAGYAYDCVNLIALAAAMAKSDQASPMMAEIPALSADGGLCANFRDCHDSASQGRNVDYDGASGPLQIDGNGDPSVGIYEEFGFDATGRDMHIATELIKR